MAKRNVIPNWLNSLSWNDNQFHFNPLTGYYEVPEVTIKGDASAPFRKYKNPYPSWDNKTNTGAYEEKYNKVRTELRNQELQRQAEEYASKSNHGLYPVYDEDRNIQGWTKSYTTSLYSADTPVSNADPVAKEAIAWYSLGKAYEIPIRYMLRGMSKIANLLPYRRLANQFAMGVRNPKINSYAKRFGWTDVEKPMPSSVEQYYLNSVRPRMEQAIIDEQMWPASEVAEAAKAYGITEDAVRAKRLSVAEEVAKNNLPSTVSNLTYHEISPSAMSPTTLGAFYPMSGRIIKKEAASNAVLTHELRHWLTDKLGYTGKEFNYLKDAYGKKEFAIYGKKHNYDGIASELVTTNSDARIRLLGKNASNADLSLQNKLIDSASDKEIFNAVKNANGYGYSYIKELKKANKLTPELAKAIRESMKYVGAVGVPVTLGANIYNNQYKFGGLTPRRQLNARGNKIY